MTANARRIPGDAEKPVVRSTSPISACVDGSGKSRVPMTYVSATQTIQVINKTEVARNTNHISSTCTNGGRYTRNHRCEDGAGQARSVCLHLFIRVSIQAGRSKHAFEKVVHDESPLSATALPLAQAFLKTSLPSPRLSPVRCFGLRAFFNLAASISSLLIVCWSPHRRCAGGSNHRIANDSDDYTSRTGLLRHSVINPGELASICDS
jgi:hypothetical protein